METYDIHIKVDNIHSNDEAIRQLQNAIYKISQVFYECVGEHGSMLNGNGHHMAQDLAEKSKEIWVKHQAKNANDNPRRTHREPTLLSLLERQIEKHPTLLFRKKVSFEVEDDELDTRLHCSPGIFGSGIEAADLTIISHGIISGLIYTTAKMHKTAADYIEQSITHTE